MIKWHPPAFRPVVDRIDVHLQLIGFCFPDFQVVYVEEQLTDYVFWEIVYVDHEEEWA